MDIFSDYVHLARLASSGRADDIQMLLRRTMRKARDEHPDFAEQIAKCLVDTEGSRGLRRVELRRDSNASTRVNEADFILDRALQDSITPVWSSRVREALENLVLERKKESELSKLGLSASATVLFTGNPGVGKTLAAEWLAKETGRKLMVLNLSSIMSSHLGKTGANLSRAIQAAADEGCILFLDEFDSIGKKRSDETDVGELKRLVNVLLQSLDSWPSGGLLIAATNHPELLDKAVWRRFDEHIDFPMPGWDEMKEFLRSEVQSKTGYLDDKFIELLAITLDGLSFSDAGNWLRKRVRKSVTREVAIDKLVLEDCATELMGSSKDRKLNFARALAERGYSQRKISDLTGLARDTIRKHQTS